MMDDPAPVDPGVSEEEARRIADAQVRLRQETTEYRRRLAKRQHGRGG